MIRISASDLEGFRYWKSNEDSTLEELIARLSHKEPPTPKMEAGAAFAKFMEHAREGAVNSVMVDGWEFFFALEDTIALPPMREIKAEVEMQTPSGPVTLVCKCDALDGLTVRDQKLTERFDPERYLDSLQWRAYLVVFGAKEFVYDVFVGRYDSQGEKSVTVTEYHPVKFYAYPNMKADVERAVCELAELIARYIPERKAA